MTEVGFLTAFFGGVLALLSPCSALLLPAFFASSVGARMQLLVHGFVFYLGLALTLVPFGLGIGAIGSLLVDHRGLIIGATAILLVVFGALQVFGVGFDVSRFIPGFEKLQQSSSRQSGFLQTLLLGATGGVAGFCAGPILGAILALGFAQANTLQAGTLLAVYGLGMVVPLVIIAAVWKKLGQKGQRALRGKGFQVFGRTFHTTQVITGLLLIAVGVLFWVTNGLVSAPSPVPADVLIWLQARGSFLSNPVVEIGAVVLLAAGALWAWFAWQRRGSAAAKTPTSEV